MVHEADSGGPLYLVDVAIIVIKANYKHRMLNACEHVMYRDVKRGEKRNTCMKGGR